MTDAEILALLAARDEQVLAEVSDKYRSYCFSIMRNVLENDEDCEECLNDLLLRLWNYPEPEKIVSLPRMPGVRDFYDLRRAHWGAEDTATFNFSSELA